MTLPPDFCTIAALWQAILPRELHFLAILQNSYQDRPCRAAATAELGTQLWRRISYRVWLPFRLPACTTLHGARTAQVWTVLRSARRLMQNVAKELDGAGVGYAANLLRRRYTTGAKHGKGWSCSGFAGWTLLNKHIVKTHWLVPQRLPARRKPSSNMGASENTTA